MNIGVARNMEAAPATTILHGGDLGAVRARFPNAPLPWIDLSTGINPVAWPVPPLPHRIWAVLPTREQDAALLEAAAARYCVADPASLVAAPGTQALLQLLPRLLPAARVAIVAPTYEEHALCWARQGHAVRLVGSVEEASGADVAVIVNPNNPTGCLLPPAALRGVRAGLRVIDESFIDLLPPQTSLAGDLPPDTVVLRSFGKTYGLAGVRLGFAIAPVALAERLRAELGPWSVSGPALEIGRRALSDTVWLANTAARLAVDGARLDRLLCNASFEILGGTPLFRLVAHDDAPHAGETLARHGIHVRRFEAERRWLRFGLPGDVTAFDRFADALATR